MTVSTSSVPRWFPTTAARLTACVRLQREQFSGVASFNVPTNSAATHLHRAQRLRILRPAQ